MRRHLATSAAVLSTALGTFGATAGVALAAGSAPGTATAPAATGATTSSGTTTTTKAPTSTTKAPTSTPSPAPVKASPRLYLLDAFSVHRNAVTVPGRLLHVGGVVRPYVAGQWVEVKAYAGRKLIKSDELRIKPSRNGAYGSFTAKVRSPAPGILRIKVTHKRTRQMLGFLAVRGVATLSPHAGFGSGGAFVALVQQRLAALHLYIPQTGVYDQQTGLALDAYHRLLGWGTSQSLDGATISSLIAGRGAFRVRYPHDGTHVEGNLGKQLLALIHGSDVYAIYPISSGKPSTPTVLGHFHVYLRTPGYLPDGMFYSSFFYGGYAIHGFNPAPDYAASHGCMRLPIVDAISVFDWLNYGDVVDVYQ
jgi:hypothetical protein